MDNETRSNCYDAKDSKPIGYIDPRLLHENGKGVPLNKLPPQGPLYMVEFKSGRIDYYYIAPTTDLSNITSGGNGFLQPMVGDLVIVEADRGKDLGKVAQVALTCEQVLQTQQQDDRVVAKNDMDETSDESPKQHNSIPSSPSSSASNSLSSPTNSEQPSSIKNSSATRPEQSTEEMYVKRIHRLATPDEINMLLVKSQDEQRALVICQQKVKQRKLQMEVMDAEYQWDRRKLTFYFSAEKRIDFRELVREMFKIYKTRIWM
ncbi:PSP1 C-terminal conserved region-domain-containing protein [Halteromyces radiatus]|uniref:PSP1 C-terminal conserved region-domain-containing protein n=1 Tax=Halteromyces radiatus TaxID=101107 RepID=UPI00221E7B8E|nr:PSP1 C-terminal conserved region-domain-containing protein [Halteromyces radiatus]KAI8082768.1 PSP1 C-terminal conserved region-domain-containing protein [Halteromyces radiatus]